MMKTLVSSVLAGLLAMAGPAIGKEAVVGLSPFGTPEQILEQAKAVARHLAETVEPGERAWVVDAYSQDQIAEFVVPDDPERYAGLQAKMRANGGFFRSLKVFAEAARPVDDDGVAGLIDVSAFLRGVGARYPAEGSRDLILYAASPLSHDVRDPAFSMAEGAVPNDAHVAAHRSISVYGAAGEGGLLSGYTVHWGAPDASWSLSDRHAHHVQRFLGLAVFARGGVLATFANEPEAALRGAAENRTAPVGDYDLKPSDTPLMILYRVAKSMDARDGDVSIHERELSRRKPARHEFEEARAVEVAIRWDCDCDFDVVVQPAGGVPISFRRTSTAFGTLRKDHTSPAALNAGWEVVQLPGPIDLTAALVALNLYSGAAGGEVELRVAIEGETWGKRFAMGRGGDGGAGFSSTLQRRAPANAAWAVVDLASLAEAGPGIGR